MAIRLSTQSVSDTPISDNISETSSWVQANSKCDPTEPPEELDPDSHVSMGSKASKLRSPVEPLAIKSSDRPSKAILLLLSCCWVSVLITFKSRSALLTPTGKSKWLLLWLRPAEGWWCSATASEMRPHNSASVVCLSWVSCWVSVFICCCCWEGSVFMGSVVVVVVVGVAATAANWN